MSSAFRQILESSPEAAAAFRDGIQPIPAGEYRLLCGEFKAIPDRKALVLKFLVDGKGDGSPSGFDNRSVDLWLNFGSVMSAAIARDKCQALGLDLDDFSDDATGKIPAIITVRAIITQGLNPQGVARNDIGKILEIVSREPQSVQVDSLEAY
jgi:hypothetical protein